MYKIIDTCCGMSSIHTSKCNVTSYVYAYRMYVQHLCIWYIYIYIHTYVYIYICIYIVIYIYIHTNVTYVHEYMIINVSVYVWYVQVWFVLHTAYCHPPGLPNSQGGLFLCFGMEETANNDIKDMGLTV